jgi:hypothetical protein
MSLRDWQTQLSRVLLLPNAPDLPSLSSLQGVESHRVALYEELLFNTVLETLQNIYPYTYQLLSQQGEKEGTWLALAEQYRRDYPNQSYKLMGAVCHFPDFLATQTKWMKQYPYLKDLALYEWLEMVVLNLPNMSESIDLPGSLPDLPVWRNYKPVWNSARQLHSFSFHVPEILEFLNRKTQTIDRLVVEKKPVDILIYRDPQTLQARFFCLNALTAQLICQSGQLEWSYQDAIESLQEGLPALHAVPLDVILQQASNLFQTCLANGILLGSARI